MPEERKHGDEDKLSRMQFLLNRHGQLWTNIDRSMRGVWNILATITLTGATLTAVEKEYLPLPLGAFLAFGIVFWAINMAIELNAWHRRNLFFIAAIEREFLSDRDYGRLLPRRYKVPENNWILFYTINMVTFAVLLLGIMAYVAYRQYGVKSDSLLRFLEANPHWLVLLIGVIVTVLNWDRNEKSAREHLSELFKSAD